jgi:hypothetical protein
VRTGLFVTGIILTILGIIGYVYPVSEYNSISDLHELCSSGLGQHEYFLTISKIERAQ